jgi:hypothetical protein
MTQARQVPPSARGALRAVARKVFWWGEPDLWLDDIVRFVAQVMTFGDLDDIRTTLRLLGDGAFLAVLDSPPAGVFDIKSWTFWHLRYHRAVPPLPRRAL